MFWHLEWVIMLYCSKICIISKCLILDKIHRLRRLYHLKEQKNQFWHQIRNQRKNLPRKPLFIRQFYIVLGRNSYFLSESVKLRFAGKWPIFTVSTVFKNTNVISDAGFVFSVKIYPGIRTPYAFLSLFSGGTATSENFEISKSRGLVILTTGHCERPIF